MSDQDYNVVLIIPTGIGARIGGYAGDAIPLARAIAQVSDHLITHPNVLNGAQLYWSDPKILYVEGYSLDQFASQAYGLAPVVQNRIGLILDQGIEDDLRWRQIQAAEATRGTLGLSITDYLVTDTPLGVKLAQAASGASWGTIDNPGSLLRAAEQLIKQAGATAIAVVARFPEEDAQVLENYRQGQGVDPIAGAEAVISHLVVREFQIPCAHAPALNSLPLNPNLAPKAAAEELGYTFLPCILVGLSRAPQLTPQRNLSSIWADQVKAVVIPGDASGSSCVLSFAHTQAQIIAVTDNQTQMRVTPESLGIKVTRVQSYLEALGVIVAHRAGIAPSALSPELSRLHRLDNYRDQFK